jgi:murein tripeptide amidase MpaA
LHSRRRPIALLAAAATAAGGAVALSVPSASAAPVNVLKASGSSAVACFSKVYRGSRSADSRTFTSTVAGIVQARLSGGGDWDLAVFDSRTGAVVAGSSGYRTSELAEGFVTKGQGLIVQGCRYRGSAATANLTVEFFAQPTPPSTAQAGPAQVVEVATPKRADKTRLQRLGLDLTEHGDADSVEVLLHGTADARKLKAAGFRYSVEIADLQARSAANRRADRRYAAAVATSSLPSGRTFYRRLFEYQYEMKRLALAYPTLVRALRLPYKTIEGRDVEGIEVTYNAQNAADGKPVFFNMGVHHAREWPSSEHVLEFAYDLIKNRGKARNKTLLATTRTVFVPVVNPDGFNVSREAPSIGATFGIFDYEYKRKNCRATDAPEAYRGGTCGANPAGRLRGTDPNRNYAGFWGGPGASPVWSSDVYRGSAPFSEPETKNVRHLVSNRQVTGLITNHTYSNLILRPPGVYAVRPPLDDPQAKAIADRMASRNGYSSQFSWQLYDTTGTTEDWSFWNTGGFGYTFEIGPEEFHPPYQQGVVAEYMGLAPAAGAGKGGNRAAYYDMLTATGDRRLHSRIQGQAPKGVVLRVHKEFSTPTSPIIQVDGTVSPPILYKDVLDTTYRAPGGTFRFAVNPSTRPYVAGRLGRDPLAPPQPSITLPNPAGIPAENQGDPLTGANEQIPFTVQGLPQYDNETATVSVTWASPNTDWDLYVINAQGQIVAQSAQGGTTREDAILVNPAPGEYRAVLVNYEGGATDDWQNGAVTFANPIPTTYGPKETWTLTCETAAGRILGSQQVYVDRGQTVDIGNPCRPGGSLKRR